MSSLEIKTPAFFRALGVFPFWALNTEDTEALAKHTKSLARKYHPDLIPLDASDEERSEIEAKSSEINAAIRILKDDIKRVDAILQAVEDQRPEEFSMKSQVKLPMELSMAYFEAQELLEDGANKDNAQEKLREFEEQLIDSQKEELTKFAEALNEAESKIQISETAIPDTWKINKGTLERFADLRGLEKYMTRILVDIRKFR